MKVKKIKAENDEFVFVEDINLGILKIKRCIDENRNNIFLRESNSSYKIINTKIILKILEKKYEYNINTDICEIDNEKK